MYSHFLCFLCILPTLLVGQTYDIIRMPGERLELNSNLPVIVISTNGAAIPDKYKIPAHMGVIWKGNDSINHLGDPFNHYDGSIGIEIRGQSSQMFPKKSYAVETRDSSGANLDVPLLGMPDENDWVLYAPYSDKSMLRNTISFEMAGKMSGYHSRSRFCEVVINDDYKGVYVLMEKIKKDSNRVDIATLNPDEISGDDLTGGYIIKVDKTDNGFELGPDGWESSPVPPFPNAKKIIYQYCYPEKEVLVPNQKNYIQTYILSVENTLTRKGFTDPEYGYHKYLDVPSFIDMMLLNEVSKEVDKYRYSTYFYKDKESNGGKLHAGPAWDFDLGYGNVDYWSPGVDFTGWMYDDVCLYDGCIIFFWKRLMEDTYFRNLARTRWEKLRQGKLSDDKINTLIDSIVTLIDSAQMRNFERWPILGKYVWPNYNWKDNDYEDEVAYFRNFLFNRLHWMDGNLPGSVLHPWADISGEGKKIRLKLYDDYFRTNILEPEDFTLNDGPPGASITVLDYLSPSECAMAISADLHGYPDFSVTIDKKALNTYDDLTSNKLSAAGMVDITEKTVISIFQVNRDVHIVSSNPEKLPDEVKILNLTGQTECTYRLEKIRENIIIPSLAEGLYLFIFEQTPGYIIKKVPIIKTGL